jgi:hypothetical protein
MLCKAIDRKSIAKNICMHPKKEADFQFYKVNNKEIFPLSPCWLSIITLASVSNRELSNPAGRVLQRTIYFIRCP